MKDESVKTEKKSQLKNLKVQKYFSRINSICLYCYMVVVIMSLVIGDTTDDNYAVAALFITILFVSDYLFSLFNYIDSKYLLAFIRYLQALTITVMTMILDFSPAGTTIMYMMLFLILLEYVMVYDYENKVEIVIVTFTIAIPYIVAAVYMTILDGMWFTGVEYVVGMTIYIIVFAGVVKFWYDAVENNEKKILAKERIIDSLKLDYDKLGAMQEKILHVNDQLNAKGIELENAYKSLDRSNKETTVQYELQEEYSKKFEVESIIHEATDKLVKFFGLSFAMVTLYDDKDLIEDISITLMNKDDNKLRDLLIHIANDKVHIAGMKRVEKHYYVNKVNSEDYPVMSEQSVGSLCCVPVNIENGTGFILVGSKMYDYFNDNNSVFFTNMANQMAVFITNARLYDKLEQISKTDGLSQLYNRGYFNTHYKDIVDNLENYKNVSMAILDIDHFKIINDTYGHPFGDLVIRHCADKIQQIAKKEDAFVARYGGEEFAIMITNKTYTEVVSIVHDIHESILSDSVYNEELNKYISYNVSIGVAVYPDVCNNINMLLNRADKALYYSKEHGRNTITFDDGKI